MATAAKNSVHKSVVVVVPAAKTAKKSVVMTPMVGSWKSVQGVANRNRTQEGFCRALRVPAFVVAVSFVVVVVGCLSSPRIVL